MSVIEQGLFFKIFGSGCFGTSCDGKYADEAERRVIVAMARHVRPATVIEYGIQAGRMARVLLGESNCIERYIGIDAADPAQVAERQRHEFCKQPGELVDDARLAVVLRPPRMALPWADMIFIDGGHDYACVAADTEEAFSVINRGGVILWHDYRASEPGVIRCIDEHNADDRICLIEGTSVCFKFF